MYPARIAAIKPPALKAGDTIGIVAPASPFQRNALSRGMGILQSMGYDPRPASGIFAANGFLAGDDAHRAAQLMAMFADDTVHAIMCARGGYGALRLVSLLDYDLIRAHPKPFIGFSDITVLHQAMLLRSGIVSFHGPMVCTLHPSDSVTRNAWRRALQPGPPVVVASAAHRVIRSGCAQGPVVGGNLASLCHLLGTPFASYYRDCILFVEDTGERPYRIDRMLVHMKLSGSLDGLAGMVLGSFKDCGTKRQIDAMVRQLFDGDGFPIMSGVAAGHGKRNLTLPLGMTAVLDTQQRTLRFLDTAVAD